VYYYVTIGSYTSKFNFKYYFVSDSLVIFSKNVFEKYCVKFN